MYTCLIQNIYTSYWYIWYYQLHDFYDQMHMFVKIYLFSKYKIQDGFLVASCKLMSGSHNISSDTCTADIETG